MIAIFSPIVFMGDYISMFIFLYFISRIEYIKYLFYEIEEPMKHVSPPLPFFSGWTLGVKTLLNHQLVG